MLQDSEYIKTDLFGKDGAALEKMELDLKTEQPADTSRQTIRSRAVQYMLIDSLSYSLIPVLAALSVKTLHIVPYMFLSLCLAAACYTFVVRKSISKIFSMAKDFYWLIVCTGIASSLAFFFMVYSYLFTNNDFIPTVVFQTYPFFIVFFSVVARMSKEDITFGKFSIMLLSIVGVVFIFIEDLNIGSTVFTVQAVFYSLLAAIFNGLTVILVMQLVKKIQERGFDGFFSLIVSNYYLRISSLLCITPFFIYFMATGTTIEFSFNNITILLVHGILCLFVGSVFYYKALNITEKSLSIHMISYLSIVFSIIWLWMLQMGDFTTYILIGTCFILVSNILLNFDLEANYAYVASIFSILILGTLLYFVPGGFYIEEYFNAASVLLVFFGLLLSFFLDRIIKRTENEKLLTIGLINDVINDQPRPSQQEKLANLLIKMNEVYRKSEVNNIYIKLLNNINSPKLNQLMLSRIQGVNFSEIVVLILIACLIVFIAIMYRPSGFVYELFALIVSTTVIFNIFYLYDKYKERISKIFKLEKVGDGFVLKLQVEEQIEKAVSEKIISYILFFSLIVLYIIIFLNKNSWSIM